MHRSLYHASGHQLIEYSDLLMDCAGTGMSSGVNFAVPIDVVRLVVPRLIVFGTSLPQTILTERMAAPSLPAAREGVAENLYK